MSTLWPTLIEFLLRLATGLAVAMFLTSARSVTSGFFRIQSWVLMGLGTFASLIIYSQSARCESAQYESAGLAIGLSVAAAVTSYISAVVWMYESKVAGKVALALVALLLILAGNFSDPSSHGRSPILDNLDFGTGAMLLGSFLSAMLLGHWYLNFPGMQLAPLKKLVLLCGASVVVRSLFSAYGITQLWLLGNMPNSTIDWCFLVFRWLAGFVGPGVMAWLAWETLKVPNTQSATGILYAALTLTFLGELTSQLLSRGLPLPV